MPNFSSLAGLEVAAKFVVVGGVGWGGTRDYCGLVCVVGLVCVGLAGLI